MDFTITDRKSIQTKRKSLIQERQKLEEQKMELEALRKEMVAAMTYSMPLRSLCSFGGFSRAEIQEMIDKLQAIYSNPLK